jgi:P27 family predicted phage terminase small subunit
MKRGRKPKPTVLHKLHGTFNVTRHRQDKPAAAEILAPPAWFDRAQKRRWARMLRDAPKKVLRRADTETMAAYVVAGELIQTAVTAQRKIDATAQLPLVVRTEKGNVAISPYTKILLKAIPMLVRTASELGFTPSSRTRLPGEEEAGDMSQFERWGEILELGRNRVQDNWEAMQRQREESEQRVLEEKAAEERGEAEVIELQTPPPALAKAEP